MKSIFAIALAAILACAPVLLHAAAPAGGFSATTLDLTATGEVKLAPDMATIGLGVSTTARTAGEAIRANAARMTQVVAALKSAGLKERDIRTAQLSLSPQYADMPNAPQRLTGYQASNQADVEVDDLAKLGQVIDAVVFAGADNIGQLSFGLANPAAAENSARVVAVKVLQDKAALYAQATGYRIGRLVNLSEGGGYRPGPPMPMMAMAARANAATPVEAGQMTVRIDISGLFELTR
jgi:hypothetical protein